MSGSAGILPAYMRRTRCKGAGKMPALPGCAPRMRSQDDSLSVSRMTFFSAEGCGWEGLFVIAGILPLFGQGLGAWTNSGDVRILPFDSRGSGTILRLHSPLLLFFLFLLTSLFLFTLLKSWP
jgi:hypothetical protein